MLKREEVAPNDPAVQLTLCRGLVWETTRQENVQEDAECQTSPGNPYGCPEIISGAIYDGVPQKTFSFWPTGIATANPKSMIFTSPFRSISTFSSLMSRCTTRSEWQNPIPSQICLKIVLALVSSKRLNGCFRSKDWSDPPDTYSMTM